MKLTLQEASETGRKVIEARHIAKSYGGVPVVRDFSTKIARGDRVGIVGPNGAGKTTLINMLTGVLAPDSGQVKLGTNLEIATLDQRRESLDPDTSVAATLTGGRGDCGDHQRRAAPRHRLHEGLPVQARAGADAGQGAVGRRARPAVARKSTGASRPTSWCSTSRPTISTSRRSTCLQEMLAAYPGTLILVSHDRDFLDRTVTSVIASEGDGRWIEYAGGYSDMVAQRGHGTGELKREKPVAKSAS